MSLTPVHLPGGEMGDKEVSIGDTPTPFMARKTLRPLSQNGYYLGRVVAAGSAASL